jgi:hypothetical protein
LQTGKKRGVLAEGSYLYYRYFQSLKKKSYFEPIIYSSEIDSFSASRGKVNKTAGQSLKVSLIQLFNFFAFLYASKPEFSGS